MAQSEQQKNWTNNLKIISHLVQLMVEFLSLIVEPFYESKSMELKTGYFGF
jgi:hypothetical protein